MRSNILALLAIPLALVGAQKTHGEDAEGTVMGPVAFLWPPDRLWNATNDNTGPCGSPDGPKNRSEFPLSQGSVALTIADDAWHVAFRLAIGNDPKTQAEFNDQVVDNVTDVDPGHQCYKIEPLENIVAGTNATIQLEYWAEYEGENNGNNQSFFACADITFVETKLFKTQVNCFNVTTDGFNAPTPSPSSSGAPAASASGSGSPAPSSSTVPPASSGGLSAGAKAGIAVGVIVGVALIAGVGFFLWRRGKATGLKGKEEYELRAKTLNTPPGDQ